MEAVEEEVEAMVVTAATIKVHLVMEGQVLVL